MELAIGEERMLPQVRQLSNHWQGTHVAPIATVERGPSEGARSGSMGAM
jgi:hypothetical protein